MTPVPPVRAVVGSLAPASDWPAGEQFWIKCGNFVDTSRNIGANYRDRFVDSSGNLSWGESICYSAGGHTVEVWTQSGVRKTVPIPGAEPPTPLDPTLSVWVPETLSGLVRRHVCIR